MTSDTRRPLFVNAAISSMEAIWNQVDAYQKWLGAPYRDNDNLIAKEAAEPTLLWEYDGVGEPPDPKDPKYHPIPPPPPVNEIDETSSAE